MDTKALRQKILDLAIHGKLVPQDPNDEPASVLLERIKAEKERLIKEGKIKRSKKSAKTSDTPHYENVPFEVPDNWVWMTLGEVGTWQSGGTPSRSNKTYYGGNIPWLKTGDLNDGLISDIPESITEEAVANSSAKINPAGSVLIAMYGATIGKLGILTFPATTNQACCACIEFNAITQLYLFYFLLSQRNGFIAKGGGGAQPNISKEIIVNTFIPLPPLSEQQRIVMEIEKWFALIDQVEQGKADLQNTIKQTKSKILDLAIHGKLVPQDPNDEPAIKLLKRINPDFTPCDNGHYTQLPNGWTVAPMQVLCSLVDGDKQKGIERINLDVKYLRGERDAKTLTSGKYVTANSLLILVDGENSGEVFRTSIDGYQGSTFKQLLINENMNEEYVLQAINLHRKVLRESKVGSAIPHLNKKLFKAIEIPIPPYKEQQRIIKAITKAFMSLDLIMESL
ncbi:restriction endonuclease subunit S [Bacteroides thetaiotaomicron]|uniref:restriction endonuclease subunit S n=2 Tax=Bacteroides thetaiotaomicron TaxID=818 RepID=UPI0015F7DBA8|nr:restriction endonuclease subunit S [Bacteroides thetaiotaomicron]MBV4102803.1 restriction endonuclease subunit S [Bacteroides thetaiotaomicron]MCE8841072.1 restriction endonuclease subunit S [Bacteroides thetaiotaomicron]MCS2348959.1 restriction endonuclease subunit S [Bacteroides thetaiotaomicron]MCS2364756.1 restriction endonuclease subunit S [Bacteroides thetaiotaomicron]MCS2516918.1 restriction endonuclease subunit S [Bacteroides thetaiotaomicron]